MAVNESTGIVYVVERLHNKVERWNPATKECLGFFGVNHPGAIAVDNSGGESQGDVYVAGAIEREAEERFSVKKFDSEGKIIRSFKRFRINGTEIPAEFREFEELGSILGLAVDGSGRLWVYTPEALTAFMPDEKTTFEQTIETFGTCFAMPGLAVTPGSENFYVGRDREHKDESCEEARKSTRSSSSTRSANRPPKSPTTRSSTRAPRAAPPSIPPARSSTSTTATASPPSTTAGSSSSASGRTERERSSAARASR
jgi:hypothetical protein